MKEPRTYVELKLRAQLAVLRDLVNEYRGRTIDNIIDNLEQRQKFYENAK
jgi:hypothetical protein